MVNASKLATQCKQKTTKLVNANKFLCKIYNANKIAKTSQRKQILKHLREFTGIYKGLHICVECIAKTNIFLFFTKDYTLCGEIYPGKRLFEQNGPKMIMRQEPHQGA